jgi:hypothetical protein
MMKMKFKMDIIWLWLIILKFLYYLKDYVAWVMICQLVNDVIVGNW